MQKEQSPFIIEAKINYMKKAYSIYGLPSCGKTTQAQILAQKFNYLHVNMGEILRTEINSGSVLGAKIKQDVQLGDLISDDLMLELLKKIKLENQQNGFIFDGFPRIISQLFLLDNFLNKQQIELQNVFLLQISEETVLTRIKNRAQILHRPDDNDEQVIKNRLTIFYQESKLIISHYQKTGLLINIDGEKPIADITTELEKYF